MPKQHNSVASRGLAQTSARVWLRTLATAGLDSAWTETTRCRRAMGAAADRLKSAAGIGAMLQVLREAQTGCAVKERICIVMAMVAGAMLKSEMDRSRRWCE